jgi:hypothetical protein
MGTDTGASVSAGAGGVSTGTGGVGTATGSVGQGSSPQDMVAAVTSGLNGYAATTTSSTSNTTSVPASIPVPASTSTSTPAPASSTYGNGRSTDTYNTPTWPAQSHILSANSNSSKSQNSPPIVPILPLPLPPSDPVNMGGKSYGVEKVSTDVNSTLQKGLGQNDTPPLPLLSTPVKSKSTAAADPAIAGDIDGMSAAGFGTDKKNKKNDTVATGGCCIVA